ncbi:Protein FAR1-related sequence 9 [Vitis vinifera]|uniref:Protein FAR1-related sequence 9 n=1 Tax=Vitis vinifera TaxID=29760 RepID=A0A438EU39_VITVI|nr:Protein FAR1-related sequence 9 [Vitis vinifera]
MSNNLYRTLRGNATNRVLGTIPCSLVDLHGAGFFKEQDKRIEELTAELENASQRCEAYRASLLAVLKDMEEEKLKIAVKVQNTRLNLKG